MLAELYAEAIARALTEAKVDARRCRRPPACTARRCAIAPSCGYHVQLNNPARVAETTGHRRRRRFPQSRRRGGRPGRAARAGVPRGAVRAPDRASRRRQRRRHRQHHGSAARMARCAASTPARATCCSICGARAHRGSAYDAQGAWARDRQGRFRRCSTRCSPTRFRAAAARRARIATTSICSWLDEHLAGRRQSREPRTCRRRSSRSPRARSPTRSRALRARRERGARLRRRREKRRADAALAAELAPRDWHDGGRRAWPSSTSRRWLLRGSRARRSRGGRATCRRSPARRGRACSARSIRVERLHRSEEPLRARRPRDGSA